MPFIHLNTIIYAPIQRVFDVSCSIDLHEKSMAHTNERAVAGRKNGLINLNETVTWEAKHLFKKRYLSVAITHMNPYSFFQDEMIKGDFKRMIHEHHFKEENGAVKMTDTFYFESPYGIIGHVVNLIFLTGYMKRLLQKRNRIIKQYAETELWKTVLQK